MGKRQSGLSKKRGSDLMEAVSATDWRIWYINTHEKTLPGFITERGTKEGFKIIAKGRQKLEIRLGSTNIKQK